MWTAPEELASSLALCGVLHLWPLRKYDHGRAVSWETHLVNNEFSGKPYLVAINTYLWVV